MNYQSIQADVARIAETCGRKPQEITIVTVSKEHPWTEAASAYANGCRNFGENRLQEALEKQPQAPQDIQWHLIGTLQKNKVHKAIGKFALIHSVDSLDLAKKISISSADAKINTPILLQVNVSGESSKHGFSPTDCKSLFPQLKQLSHLKIEGLMTMAPFVEDEALIRRCFADLRTLRDELALTELSMGMSHDYPIAIEEGATLLRIGTAIF